MNVHLFQKENKNLFDENEKLKREFENTKYKNLFESLESKNKKLNEEHCDFYWKSSP